jgi:hypothetical protein
VATAAVTVDDGPDPVGNLRNLCRKKQLPLAGELQRFLADFARELDILTDAVGREEFATAGPFAHALRGRAAFVHAGRLEGSLRRVQTACTAGAGPEAVLAAAEARAEFAHTRATLCAAAPADPPASIH